MAAELTLRVITPDQIVMDAAVSSVVVPGVDGLMGILPRHAPMVAVLDAGPMTFTKDGQKQAVFVSGGFCEVRDNTVRVISEAGERSTEIDEKRARAAEERARKRLDEGRRDPAVQVDILRAQLALRRAQLRLRVRGRRTSA